jgi:signal peptidase II
VRRTLPYLLLAVAATAADQFVTRLVEAGLELHVPVVVLPFLAFFRTHNTGIAFSMLDGLEGPWLVLMPVAIIAVVLYLASRTPPGQILARSGFALIIGGALGNLYDRATLGYVIDYVLFFVGNWSFAIFNLADASITVGACLVVAQELLEWRRRHTHADPGP